MSTVLMDESEVAFHEKEFDNLKFPVLSAPKDKDIAVTFPELKNLPFFNLKEPPCYKEKIIPEDGGPVSWETHLLDPNMVFRYVCYCYDKESPIFKKFMDSDKKRKTWAAYYAGWKPQEDGFFPKAVDQMMQCNVPVVNELIIDFIQLFNDPDFAMIAVSYESLFESLRVVMTSAAEAKSDSGKGTKNLFDVENTRGTILQRAEKAADSLNKRVENYLRDNNTRLHSSLYNVINREARKKLKITVERQVGIDPI